ncbi:MAG: TIGR03560 family F420-dependent LLM class oxidoreductase [Acidobacteriota bacterium]
MTKPIRFGVQTPPQNVTWQELLDTWKLIDELGYDTAWTFDHFFPIFTDPSGTCLEGWIALTALAAATQNLEVGTLVTGNTYRNPAVLAKMGATLDHITGGRLIMGVGAAWFELEHNAYGIPFYTVGERIRRFDEACRIIKSLWTEKQTTFDGKYYQIKDAYCEPKPVRRPHPPLMIGGAGEKLMLKVIAQHADQWNTFGSPELFKHKIAILREHCATIGRNPDEIEIAWGGATLVTDSPEEKAAVAQMMTKLWGEPYAEAERRVLAGSAQEIGDRINEFIEVGVTHFIMLLMPPFRADNLRRFAEEVIPQFRK